MTGAPPIRVKDTEGSRASLRSTVANVAQALQAFLLQIEKKDGNPCSLRTSRKPGFDRGEADLEFV
jgi:hypothetical protein